MFNLWLGILIGIGGSWLYIQPRLVPWYAWGLFIMAAAAIAFGFDVFFGSYREDQPRAAWVGMGIFGGLGALMILACWVLTF
jgi:hypothetical protein